MNYQKLEESINAVKEWNQEAGNKLHSQLHTFANSKWSNEDMRTMMFQDEDVADSHYADGEIQHQEIREIQHGIVNFFS